MNRGAFNVLTGRFEDEPTAPGHQLGTQVAGSGIGVRQTSDGLVFNARRARRGGGGTRIINPFQILAVPAAPDAAPDAIPTIGVAFYSGLYKRDFTKVSISGLLASNTPLVGDAGAFEVPEIGDKIWLEINTTNQDAPTAQIKYGPVGGDEWEEYPYPVAINLEDPAAPFQEFYNLLLAEVSDYETDDRPAILDFTIDNEHRQITQMFSHNIQLAQWAVDLMVCMVPVDPALDYEPSAI